MVDLESSLCSLRHVGGSWIPPINERSSVGDIFIDLIRNEDKCELTIAGSDDAGVGAPTWP